MYLTKRKRHDDKGILLYHPQDCMQLQDEMNAVNFKTEVSELHMPDMIAPAGKELITLEHSDHASPSSLVHRIP
jgi:hypothetical protein